MIDRWIGRSLGRFRLVEKIGQGGMGAVFRGEREGDDFSQTVAVKILPAALADESTLRRFQREREVLSGLDHPGVARLIEGGSSEEGVPYLVMEYVAGERMDDYCDRLRLTVDERIALFLEVCDAVSYAHRNLVVHRDLKPANILVDGGRRPKLLDFGIAKLVQPDGLPAGASGSTAAAASAGYASPEQLFGEPVSTSTDVYSMGVLLYELLAGCRPFASLEQRPADFLEALRSEVPTAPSRRVRDRPATARARSTSTRRLARALSGDLDAIVGRALRAEAAERYGSVEALKEDLLRASRGLPIFARSSQRGYRLKKFVVRNAWSVASGAASALAVLAFTAATFVQSQRLQAERDQALEEQRRSERATEFLVDIFDGGKTGDLRGVTVTAQDILSEAASRLQDDEYAAEPALRSTLMLAMARVFAAHWDQQRALELREEALRIRQEHSSPSQPSVVEAMLHLIPSLNVANRSDEAFALAKEALLTSQKAQSRHFPLALARWAYQSIEDPAHREPSYLRVLALRKRLFGPVSREVRNSYRTLGLTIRFEPTRRADRVRYFESALRLQRVLTPGDHPDIAELLVELARSLAYYRDAPEIPLDLADEAYAMTRRLYGPGHLAVTNDRQWRAHIYTMLGAYEVALPEFAATVPKFRRHYSGTQHAYYETILVQYAYALVRAGQRYPEAEALMREASQRAVARGVDLDPLVSSLLGVLLARQGRMQEAEHVFDDLREYLSSDPRDWQEINWLPMLSRAEALMREDRSSARAEAVLLEACPQIAKFEARSYWPRRCYSKLVELYEARGDRAAVDRYRPSTFQELDRRIAAVLARRSAGSPDQEAPASRPAALFGAGSEAEPEVLPKPVVSGRDARRGPA